MYGSLFCFVLTTLFMLRHFITYETQLDTRTKLITTNHVSSAAEGRRRCSVAESRLLPNVIKTATCMHIDPLRKESPQSGNAFTQFRP
jgi:hypothetical protein